MVASWPNRSWRSSEYATAFLSLLSRLGDEERIDAFLTEVPAAGVFAKLDAEAVAGALALLPPARSAELTERIFAATLKKGTPHSLICTKNQASYHSRVRQREEDLKTLARIEAP
jgi:hypothetical protein